MLSRRRFLGLAGGAAVGVAAGGTALWTELARGGNDSAHGAAGRAPGGAPTTSSSTGAPGTAGNAADRVLVILQLGGGNDGLNTLVPDLGIYRDARPTLALPESSLVPVDAPGYALHPALAPLRDRWDRGQIVALQGIGLPGQSRSHFTAMDTWWSGTAGVASTTGWLGRWLDATAPDVPDPVRAISLGTGAPALRGVRSLPTVVLDPAAFDVRVPRNAARAAVTAALRATAAPVSPAPWLAAAQAAVPAALDAITVLDKATAPKGAPAGAAPNGATTDAAKAGSANALLQAAAGIIELGVGTRVLLVGISGFDTHAGQLERHAALLDDVGRGVAAFFDRLEASGHAGNVLLMTTSEFGRRVAENGSGGCDHGSGGVQFVVGPAVRGARVVGEASLDRLVDGDMPIGIDARSLYAVGLDWLGGPTDDLLGGRFDRYGIL